MVNDFGDEQMAHVMQFAVGEPANDQFRIPEHLSTVQPLAASQAIATRTFQFQTGDVNGTRGWLIDDAPFSPTNISASVKLGTVEVWRLIADFHHPVHIHLNPFQVLSRGLGGPGEFDHGWKDTIDLRPAEEASIAIQFGGSREIRFPLPQPRTRRHGDDGQFRNPSVSAPTARQNAAKVRDGFPKIRVRRTSGIQRRRLL